MMRQDGLLLSFYKKWTDWCFYIKQLFVSFKIVCDNRVKIRESSGVAGAVGFHLPAVDGCFMLTEAQFAKIEPLLPKSRGKLRVNDRRVISGIIHVIKSGCKWSQLPACYGSHKTAYNRFYRWSRNGIWEKITKGLMVYSADDNLQTDSGSVKVHRTACSLKLNASDRAIGKTNGGWNTKIHVVCNNRGPLDLDITAGNIADITVAHKMLGNLKGKGRVMLADKGYDSDDYRRKLDDIGIDSCIPGRKNRKTPIVFDEELYRERNWVERIIGRLKDYRGVATRYTRCPALFLSFVYIAALVIFWL